MKRRIKRKMGKECIKINKKIMTMKMKNTIKIKCINKTKNHVNIYKINKTTKIINKFVEMKISIDRTNCKEH
jgi:hypothetical protein